MLAELRQVQSVRRGSGPVFERIAPPFFGGQQEPAAFLQATALRECLVIFLTFLEGVPVSGLFEHSFLALEGRLVFFLDRFLGFPEGFLEFSDEQVDLG